MVGRVLGRLALATVAGLALGAAMIGAPAPAHADSFAFGYSSGGYYPRHHHHRYYGPRYVYAAPPVYYYPPPPPRVVYVTPPPPPVYVAPPPPVVYQAPQTLPGGPLASQSYCREYQSTSVVNNQTVQSYGTACQQPDGSWQIVR